MVLQFQVWYRGVATPHRHVTKWHTGLGLGHIICREMQSFGGEIGKKETTWKTLARWKVNIKAYLKK
jgi:hypothetical protein